MNKVLLIYKHKNLSDQFLKNLIDCDFDVYNFYDDEVNNQLNFIEKIENIFFRTIFNNKQHILKILNRKFQRFSNKKLKKLKKEKTNFDYCLIIRGDLVPENVLQYARIISVKMVDFQLDGVSVSKKILQYLNYFDSVWVFDKEDSKNYKKENLRFISNCWFSDENNEPLLYDFYYLGNAEFNRQEQLDSLLDASSQMNLKSKILLLQYANHSLKKHPQIEYFKSPLTYSENLQFTKQSRILLDFKRPYHNGLSLRFFEALAYNKKIITNNFTVKTYDFYHPNNIFVTDYQNFNGLEEFLKKPHHQIPETIRLKYRFDNWIKELFDLK